VECALEGPLPVFQEDQVEFLLGCGFRLVELEQIRRILPPFRLLQDAVVIKRLYGPDGVGEDLVHFSDNYVPNPIALS